MKNVLVSDAGTPAIADPGYRLVRLCRQRGIPVVAIPGPSAAVTAIAASGLPSDEFLFGRVSEVKTHIKPLGEFVVVVGGATELREAAPLTREEVLKKLGLSRNQLYDLFFK